jgi:hypothetical protein
MKKKYRISGCGFDSIPVADTFKFHKCSEYTEVLSDCELFTIGLVTSYTLQPSEAQTEGQTLLV